MRESKSSRVTLFGWLVALLVMAGCAAPMVDSSNSESTLMLTPEQLIGLWEGVWQSPGYIGSMTVQIMSVEDNRLSGELHFLGSYCPNPSPFKGTLRGGKLTLTSQLGSVCGDAVLTLIWSDGKLQGTYKAYDSGSISLKRIR